MKRLDVLAAWAPTNGHFTRWVKPVLFAALADEVFEHELAPAPHWLDRGLPTPLAREKRGDHPYREDPRLDDTAIVIDLPGETSARAGVAFVDYGFRPIPLYNALPSELGVVDLYPLMALLVDGAARVQTARTHAPPAFLLDGSRIGNGVSPPPGSFDNRSMCSAADFPSAQTLHQAGIRRALLVTARDSQPALDLEPILFAWQQSGIELWHKRIDASTPAQAFVLRRQIWIRRVAHRLQRSVFRRRQDDAYGMFVPQPGAG